tara:strand:+ start:2002 stop:2190 length:189 start_codon:yes stop_codon:yes gene_type:complete
MEELCIDSYDNFKRMRAYSPQERLKLRMELAERGEEMTPDEVDILLDDIIGRVQDNIEEWKL